MKKLIAVLLVVISLYAVYKGYYGQLKELRVNIERYVVLNNSERGDVFQAVMSAIYIGSQLLPKQNMEAVPLQLLLQNQQVEKTLSKKFKYANIMRVFTTTEILKAMKSAKAGTLVVIAPGKYKFNQHQVYVTARGMENRPIVFTTEKFGDVTFELASIEGFSIQSSFIIFEKIIFEGHGYQGQLSEHAIHLSGNADHIIIQGNRFENFNSHIKANATNNIDSGYLSPDAVIVTDNVFLNDKIRPTNSPTSPIDVVGGKNWKIANNFIADFAKTGDRKTSYGILVKGKSSHAEITNNIIACSWQVALHSALDSRVAITFGNGGTANKFCNEGVCDVEHEDGIIKGNEVYNCPTEPAIYLHKSQNISIINNRLSNTLGVHLNSAVTTATLSLNQTDGYIKTTDKATYNQD